MPVGIPVIFRAIGTKTRSYIGMRKNMNMRGMTGIEGPGILKLMKVLSMVVLCWTEKVWSCAKHVFMKTVLSMMGSMRKRILVSSTSVTVQSLHWSDSAPVVDSPSSDLLITAARSKNLGNNIMPTLFY